MYRTQAIEKLNKEEEAFKGDRYGQCIYKAVAAALRDFCEQDDEFAQAVVQTDRTLSDCVKEVTKGVGNVLSDLDAYRRAAKFYFSTADVKFIMQLDLCGDLTAGEAEKRGKVIHLTLDDLF